MHSLDFHLDIVVVQIDESKDTYDDVVFGGDEGDDEDDDDFEV